MPTTRRLFTRWLPLLVWASLIFIGSTDLLAAQHTSRFVVPFLRWLLGSNFTPECGEYLHHLIRKGGHLSEYAVLCVLLWRALASLRTFQDNSRRLYLAAVLVAAAYAATDEYHQSFIPTRTASIYDVMIDTLGACLGLALYLALTEIFSRWRGATTVRPDSPAHRPSLEQS